MYPNDAYCVTNFNNSHSTVFTTARRGLQPHENVELVLLIQDSCSQCRLQVVLNPRFQNGPGLVHLENARVDSVAMMNLARERQRKPPPPKSIQG